MEIKTFIDSNIRGEKYLIPYKCMPFPKRHQVAHDDVLGGKAYLCAPHPQPLDSILNLQKDKKQLLS